MLATGVVWPARTIWFAPAGAVRMKPAWAIDE